MTATRRTRRPRATLDELVGQGEDALHRLTELPGAGRALQLAQDLRSRVDELGRRVRGLDELEARVAKLERELATLRRAQKAATKAPSPKAPSRKAASS